MRIRSRPPIVWLLSVFAALVLLGSPIVAQDASTASGDAESSFVPPEEKPPAPEVRESSDAEPAKPKPKPQRSGGAGPADPPAYYRDSASALEGPSVVEGLSAGIEVGDSPPDFELEPIEPYAILEEWLGADAAVSLEKKVTLSDLVGEMPVMLLFGSYT